MSHDCQLEPILQAVEPRARLVPERYLRQVQQFLEDEGRPQPVNSNLPLWVSRNDLQQADILPNRMMQGDEPLLLLITDPDDRLFSRLTPHEQLLAYWRVLFQASVMREIDSRVALGSLDARSCEEKLTQLGGPAKREIETVLTGEHLVLPNPGTLALYRAFATTYLELAEFDPERIADYFPSLTDTKTVIRLIAEQINAFPLVESSKPMGVEKPSAEEIFEHHWSIPETSSVVLEDAEVPSPGAVQRAIVEEQKGNYVRAAILYRELATRSAESEQEHYRKNALESLARVVDRLGDLFDWERAVREEWKQASLPLLAIATTGIWPKATRCLYELQRIPTDIGQEVYAVDLPEAIRTLGRRPVKRFLPRVRTLAILMHLKKAHAQMLAAGLDQASELRLDKLFLDQMHELVRAVRAEFGPIILSALTNAGLCPRNTAEAIGRDKLVAELLDRVCDRGYLRLSDLRDAIARNQLKMPDLLSVGDFLTGDGLLRVDTELNETLDGVYQKGEIYLRVIQRFSALFFGTKLGRLFTIYLAIPFGGAFLALMFAEEVHHLGGKLVTAIARKAPKVTSLPQTAPPTPQQASTPDEKIAADQVEYHDSTNEIDIYPSEVVTSDEVEMTEGGELIWYDSAAGRAIVAGVFTPLAKTTPPLVARESTPLVAWPTIVFFGFFLLLTIHVPVFRKLVFWVLGSLWWIVRGLLWDLPRALWTSAAVRGLRQSQVARFLVRHFWSPTFITLLVFTVLFLIGISPWFLLKWGWVFWVILTFSYNSPWTWVLQDRLAETVSDWWRIVRANLLPGLIGTIVDWFKRLGNWFERQLYAVDEWLRFRGGDSERSFTVKAILGLLWFPLAYLFRFVFYLLVEPQINPVKHFPVVTVSHKVIWPMVPQIAEWTHLSPWTVGMFVNGVPGIFGFIAWELKENWRLYEANRPERLKPVMIGSHGETMRQLLRPGFHSGTVPKIFRRLRQVDREQASQYHHELDHVAEAVGHFVQRELLDLLEREVEWGRVDVQVAGVRFGCQRAVIDLTACRLGPDALTVAFENVSGQIEAELEQPGWVDKLTEHQKAVLTTALRGFLDMAAVTVYKGCPRVDGPVPLGPGLDDLGRTMTWKEWSTRWH